MDEPGANYFVDNQGDGPQHSNLTILKHMILIDGESFSGLETVIVGVRCICLNCRVGNCVAAHFDSQTQPFRLSMPPTTQWFIY